MLLFGDESEALTHPYLAHAWAKVGADLRVPAPGQAAKVALLGVLDWKYRDLVVHTSRTKRSADFITFLGACQEFRVRAGVNIDQAIAFVKRSPKRPANWALAMPHSRAGMVHSFSVRFKTRNSSFIAASSVGKCPRARTAVRSFELSASMAFVV